MTVREKFEQREVDFLSPFATKSRDAMREMPESPCLFRTAFQRDRDRIIHSKSFRRLKHKTQVYISPGDHYRMRMTHSLEVAQISRTVARGLVLNEDLTEAIALGHDVGHTPFGHSGEDALREVLGHFDHNEQSLRVLEHVEKDGAGLNLTVQVKNGILNHTGSQKPFTLEGNIVRICDRVAYLCHDYDDGIRAGMLKAQDLPQNVVRTFGVHPSSMITAMVADMITQSDGVNEIRMSQPITDAMNEFRHFMFETVYRSPQLEQERKKAKHVIKKLFEYFYTNPDKLPREFQERIERWSLETIVVDYVAGLSDLYAIHLFKNLFIPSTWGGS
ncbi:deoxyguanosinetriphosphate triphosphohydrolase [Acetonema longum]|uniref:Deoxyguanosinetriphosphate triphosphohydrolase-like protein n=1 Tax=Acetonema longum DSM 6540 TaxID=1009370 RepID=F7NKY6_9FIRM|nr:deoxyguanosinetriphosphate triphosphohydrolase [Acetonema longum]EGO63329.1 deoxyguanosinetriphosphate triphosphohydrolase-like protein [Acetonema longum DSM 6540]